MKVSLTVLLNTEHAWTSPPQSNLGRAHRSRITMQQSPHWLQWDAPNLPPNCPPFDDYHPHLIHPSLNWPHSPSQTTSRSDQPFCHNTLSRHTDRLTDGIGDRSIPLALILAILIESNVLIILKCRQNKQTVNNKKCITVNWSNTATSTVNVIMHNRPAQNYKQCS